MLVRPDYPDEMAAFRDFLRYLFLMKPVIYEISPKKISLVCGHSPQALDWEGETESGFQPFITAAEAYVLSTWNGSRRVIAALDAKERISAKPDFAVIQPFGG